MSLVRMSALAKRLPTASMTTRMSFHFSAMTKYSAPQPRNGRDAQQRHLVQVLERTDHEGTVARKKDRLRLTAWCQQPSTLAENFARSTKPGTLLTTIYERRALRRRAGPSRGRGGSTCSSLAFDPCGLPQPRQAWPSRPARRSRSAASSDPALTANVRAKAVARGCATRSATSACPS